MEWRGIKGAVLENVSMKRYTSMKVGGPVRYMVYPVDETDLAKTVRSLNAGGVPYRFLGNGTNVIVHDKGLPCALIRTSKMVWTRYARNKEGATVDVAGGVSLKSFIADNARRGLSGLEKLYWIPGTVGGGVKMNAGSFGASISTHLERLRVLNGDGRFRTIEGKELCFGYRQSPVSGSDCVVSATFSLRNGDPKAIRADMDYVYGERKKRHPMEHPSAGSIFKSVNGEPAWKCIDAAGFRGFRLGTACVSEKHANFVVNLGSARATDIRHLVDVVKQGVFEKTGVSLEEEVEFWGFGD